MSVFLTWASCSKRVKLKSWSGWTEVVLGRGSLKQRILFRRGTVWTSSDECLYMVQYASFGNFCSNMQNFQNVELAVIFIAMHYMSSYISLNSGKTL